MANPTVVVIGAGVGGAGISSLLSHMGHKVIVVEKNAVSGGRCGLIEHEGFRFDVGPSLYLLPQAFEKFFSELGEALEDHLELIRCDPNYTLYFDDGTTLQLSSDIAETKRNIEDIEPGSFKGLCRMLDEGHTHWTGAETHVLSKPYLHWWEYVDPRNLKHLFSLHVLDSLYRRVSTCFRTAKLRMAFSFQSMYIGISPYASPASYSLLQYTEFADGIWYPKGGMHRIVDSLLSIATKHGAEVRYSNSVARIETEGNRVTGVTLVDDTFIAADIVVCNADAPYAYNELLPPCREQRRISKMEMAASAFVFYWALKRRIPKLTSHNIFLAGEYKSSFDRIFDDYVLPDDPSFYIHIASRADPTAAPENCDVATVLVPVGRINPNVNQDWPRLQQQARDAVVRRLMAAGIDIEDYILFEKVNSPETWRDTYNLHQGSALGLGHTLLQVGYLRPSICDPNFKNLFFVGASIHPGTGVPIVLYGARLVKDQIIHYLNGTTSSRFVTSWAGIGLLGAVMAIIGWILLKSW